MKILLFLLLLSSPALAHHTPEYYCRELAIEIELAVERGYITRQEGKDLIQGCPQAFE